MSRRWRLIVVLLLAAAIAFSLWVAYPYLLRAMARWLDVGKPPRRADYVMLLGGDHQTRPFVAAALVGEGWARRVLVCESAPTPQSIDGILPPAHEISCRILLNQGVPPDDVVVLRGAVATTHDEAKTLAAFLEDHPDVRVLAVTSDYHTRRSRWILSRSLADRSDAVSFVSAPTDYCDMNRWWRDQWGMRFVVSEYLKLAFYLVRYGHLFHWLAACGVLAIVAAWIRRRQSVPGQTH